MFRKTLVATILAGCATNVLAWGAAGHEIIATIAQIHLHPSVFPTMCAVLNFTSTSKCHLAPIAAWADSARPKMPWSAPLHYIGAVDDYPSQTCAFPGPRGWAGADEANVLGAIRNVTDILMDWTEGNNAGVGSDYQDAVAANEALKFLVHFLGDMHNPLHLTSRDRGGNSVPVFFGGRKTNLHALWDGLLIAKALRSVPSRYNRPLPNARIEAALRGTIYDSYGRMIMWEGVLGAWQHQLPDWLACPIPLDRPRRQTHGLTAMATDDALICPHHWAAPIHELNCELVWPAALDRPPYKDTRPILPLTPEWGAQQVFSLEDAAPAPPKPKYLELDTPAYAGVISERWVVEKLLAQAGLRLAGVLNYLFADLENDGSRRGVEAAEL
ncbi:phospholipase C/P1 nuclease domain-containing protein [Mycena vitilis]|nr:phospholipase C/P1 nuclease domain-containing protein [Mycena vitilis]